MKRFVSILVILALWLGVMTAIRANAALAPGHCTVTVGTPHIEYIDNDGNAVIEGVAGLSSCIKGRAAVTLTASMGSQSGTVSKACGTVYRFACGTSLQFQETLVCSDSDDPSTLTLAVTASDGTVTRTSQAVTFDCRYYGGGE